MRWLRPLRLRLERLRRLRWLRWLLLVVGTLPRLLGAIAFPLRLVDASP